MKKVLLRASILALSCALSVAALAQTKPNVSVNVPAGDLATSLELLRKQTGLEIIYNASDLKGTRSKQLSGSYSSEDALRRLLAGSGFTLKVDASGAYAIAKQAPMQKEPPRKRKKADGEKAETGAGDDQSNVTSLPEILVKGSRSLNTDIVRTEDDIQPYVVFEREEIESSMALSVEEFLTTRLPMNQTKGTASRNVPEGNKGNRSEFNLRGIGANQTLILINGRRAPGVSMLTTGTIEQPDLNGIPISAIDRIEVLPTTASAIYGGGATGGVINVILRSDYSGSQFGITYDNSFDTDSARQVYNFSTGFPLEGGKTQVTLSGSYSAANDLLVRDRNFAQNGRQLAIDNDTETFFSPSATIYGARTNYASLDGSELVLRDGTPFGSDIGTVPFGYPGIQTDAGSGLLPGAGTYDYQIPNNIIGGAQSLYATPTKYSAYATVRREFSEKFSAYVEVGTTANKSVTRWSGFGNSVTFSPGDLGNPFQNSVRASYSIDGADTVATSDSRMSKVNTGFVLKLPADWMLGLDLNWNESTNKYSQSRGYDAWGIMGAIQSGEIDVFRDSALSADEVSQYKVGPSVYGPAHAAVEEASIRVAGPILSLPAGQVVATSLLSWRRESADSLYSGNGPYRYFPERYQDIKSMYVEAAIPLISNIQQIPFVHQLDAQVSIRRDDYSTVSVPLDQWVEVPDLSSELPDFSRAHTNSGSTDYTIGLKYKPTQNLTIRASHATGFLPVSVAQVGAEPLETYLYITDPKRSGDWELIGPLPVTMYGGGDGLKPEQSVSTSVGLIYNPEVLDWLRLSMDYTRVRKSDEIVILDQQQFINLEDKIPGRIVRGDNLPGDPPGWAGVITEVDASQINIASSNVEAIDIQLDVEKQLERFGYLHFYTVIGVQTDLSREIIAGEPQIDRVGFNDGILKYRANLGFTWRYRSLSVASNTQFYDGYKVHSSYDDSSAAEYYARIQGSEKVPSQYYTDVSLGYSFNKNWLTGLNVKLGLKNVFNKQPPTIATWDTRGGYSTYGDPRLRTYSLTLEYAF